MGNESVLKTPPRSLFRKLKLVVAEARRGRTASLQELSKAVESRGHLDFTFVSGETGKAMPCSATTILRVVKLAAKLRFILPDTGGATSVGSKAAVSDDQFAKAMREAIFARLRDGGATQGRMSGTIREMLASSRGPELPTSTAIYEALDLKREDLRPSEFRSLLTLLEASGGIRSSRRKLYIGL